MRKKKEFVRNIIITVSIIVILLAVLFIPFRNPTYRKYYGEACKYQEEENISQKIKDSPANMIMAVELCMNTGGCFFGGSACPPAQKTNLIEYIRERQEVCILMQVAQCVCPFGKKFDSGKGCI